MSKDIFEALKNYKATEDSTKQFWEREKKRQEKFKQMEDAIRIKRNNTLPIVYDL